MHILAFKTHRLKDISNFRQDHKWVLTAFLLRDTFYNQSLLPWIISKLYYCYWNRYCVNLNLYAISWNHFILNFTHLRLYPEFLCQSYTVSSSSILMCWTKRKLHPWCSGDGIMYFTGNTNSCKVAQPLLYWHKYFRIQSVTYEGQSTGFQAKTQTLWRTRQYFCEKKEILILLNENWMMLNRSHLSHLPSSSRSHL